MFEIVNENEVWRKLESLMEMSILQKLLDEKATINVIEINKTGLHIFEHYDFRDEKFNPHMLILAMAFRGFSQKDLCEKAAISKDRLRQIIKGSRPTIREWRKFMYVLRFPMTFFTREGDITEGYHYTSQGKIACSEIYAELFDVHPVEN